MSAMNGSHETSRETNHNVAHLALINIVEQLGERNIL
jgi:hypothetical protein